MTRPEPDYARVTFYHPPVLDPDPLYVPAPGTDDELWTVPEPDPPADRRPFALAVLIIALAVVAIVWWPR